MQLHFSDPYKHIGQVTTLINGIKKTLLVPSWSCSDKNGVGPRMKLIKKIL